MLLIPSICQISGGLKLGYQVHQFPLEDSSRNRPNLSGGNNGEMLIVRMQWQMSCVHLKAKS